MTEKQPTFWHRQKPEQPFDIAKIRDRGAPKGKRFETTTDCESESVRSEAVLERAGISVSEAASLRDCRLGDSFCNQLYCPLCARAFRRWFIGEAMRIADQSPRPIQMVTILLTQAEAIRKLDVLPFKHSLRKTISRAGLAFTPALGGFEVVYRARDRRWVLHINLMLLNPDKAAFDKLRRSFGEQDLYRPFLSYTLKDPAEQISYLLKFTTYHRPYKQKDGAKSPARPLNAREHVQLVRWMARYTFTDMMFLHRIRRHGCSLGLT